jgi:hypothetical protein
VALVTLTMRHTAKDSLEDLWAALSGAWKATEQSRKVRSVRDELGVVGFVRRIEATHGRNGWHLHIHALAFVEGQADDAAAIRLGDALHDSWSGHLTGKGMKAPLRAIGTDVKLLDLSDPGAAVAGYITMRSTPEGMSARELTDALGGKRGKSGNRTTWELLSAAAEGDARSKLLWWEWEAASKGKRMLTWGHKVRALLDLEEDDDDDLEGDIIAQLGASAWALVCKRRGGAVELLEIAEAAYWSQSHGKDLEHNHALGLEAAMLDVALTLDDWGVIPWDASSGEAQGVTGSPGNSRESTVSAAEAPACGANGWRPPGREPLATLSPGTAQASARIWEEVGDERVTPPGWTAP